MKRSVDQIDRLILHAVCEDLAPFESIVDGVREQLDPEELDQVANRLLALVSSRMVEAYLLHSEPPYLTPVETDADGVYRHWFFISEQGLNHLVQLPPPNTGQEPPPSSPEHRTRRRGAPQPGKRADS